MRVEDSHPSQGDPASHQLNTTDLDAEGVKNTFHPSPGFAVIPCPLDGLQSGMFDCIGTKPSGYLFPSESNGNLLRYGALSQSIASFNLFRQPKGLSSEG